MLSSGPALELREKIKDEHFMLRALALARRGRNEVSPNPPVGAVLVKEGRIIGSGWHHGAGTPHAELEALRNSNESARGATLYVTLEPCNHQGKTPPCTEEILKAGIRRVVVSVLDPNFRVKGGGAEKLREAGVEVDTGVLEEIGTEIISAWSRLAVYRVPFVTLKLAMSRDGKIAYPGNSPKRLSSNISLAAVQRLRSISDAVLIGAETYRVDRPRLTNRSGKGRQPLRIIVSSDANLDLSSLPEDGGKVLVACTERAPKKQIAKLKDKGCRLYLQPHPGRVDLASLFSELGSEGLASVLVEGGAEISEALIERRLANRIIVFQPPITIGESGLGIPSLPKADFNLRGYSLDVVRQSGPEMVFIHNLC